MAAVQGRRARDTCDRVRQDAVQWHVQEFAIVVPMRVELHFLTALSSFETSRFPKSVEIVRGETKKTKLLHNECTGRSRDEARVGAGQHGGVDHARQGRSSEGPGGRSGHRRGRRDPWRLQPGRARQDAGAGDGAIMHIAHKQKNTRARAHTHTHTHTNRWQTCSRGSRARLWSWRCQQGVGHREKRW